MKAGKMKKLKNVLLDTNRPQGAKQDNHGQDSISIEKCQRQDFKASRL